MNSNLDHVNFLKTTLDNLKPIKPELKNKIDQKFRLEFNYNSNHIEGNTLTYGETKLLLIFGDTIGNHQKREFDEMENHDVAYKLINELAIENERPLSENFIKELNSIILVKPFWKDAVTNSGERSRRLIDVGKYKNFPNSVILQNGEIFEYALPTETPIKMGELIEWYKDEEYNLHPVTLAAMMHYKFVRIHPFDDGNGRIARLLLNYVLIKFGFPPIIIKSIDKRNYLNALHLADIGNYEAFIDYVSKQLIWSLEVYIDGANGLPIEEPEDWEKELHLLKIKIPQQNLKIRQKNSFETFGEIYQKTILPILDLWNQKFIKFDELFLKKEIRLYLNTDKGKLDKTGNNLSDFPLQFFQDSISNLGLIHYEFEINFNYMNLKKSNFEKTFSAGSLEFQFDDNGYEIDTPESTLSFNYGEFLTEEQLEEIINKFGKDLLKLVKQEIL